VPPLNAEDAVRAYLRVLKADPDSLPDNPIERLLLRARVEQEFVEQAASWAVDNGIGGAAFAAEGVPVEVLRRAGLHVALRPGDEPARSIRSAMPERQPFSEDGLMARTGAARRDVRAVIAEDLRAGRIEEHAMSEVEGGCDKRLYRRTM
jgi:hypothetical protein